jgi:Zn-dependent protease with chaperone function
MIFVAWLLIGQMNIHLGEVALLVPTLALLILGIAVLSRRASKVQSMALLSVLGIMFYQSLSSIGGWVRFHLDPPAFLGAQGVQQILHTFFAVNVSLAILGVVAALGFAASLEFRNLRLPLAKLFPEVTFLEGSPDINRSVERLSRLMGVEAPQISVIDSGRPAAFITSSKRRCALAVSVGLLESMSADELDACLAHELAHLRNNDFAIRSFATSARVALFAHPLSHVIEPALYRARELLADKTASEFVDRNALISALTKLYESQDYGTHEFASVSMACLFNRAGTTGLARLFDKHPTLETRIEALKEKESL